MRIISRLLSLPNVKKKSLITSRLNELYLSRFPALTTFCFYLRYCFCLLFFVVFQGQMTVNEGNISLPFRNQDITIRKPSRLMTVVEGFGFVLKYDLFSRAYLTLTPYYFTNKVRAIKYCVN